MTAPNLSPTQRARVDAGQCACGCGEPCADGSPYAGQVNADRAIHRQRAYRQRKQSGHVKSQEERDRARQLQKAREHQAEAARLRAWAKRINAEARAHEQAAERLTQAALSPPLPLRGR